MSADNSDQIAGFIKKVAEIHLMIRKADEVLGITGAFIGQPLPQRDESSQAGDGLILTTNLPQEKSQVASRNGKLRANLV